MTRRRETWSLIPISLYRRLILGRLGFRLERPGQWRRGPLAITEETLDGLTAQQFALRVCQWRAQPSRLV
jgi:hypothetical protein